MSSTITPTENVTPGPGPLSLLDADAELARAVPEKDRLAARAALIVPQKHFAPGDRVVCDDDTLGLLAVHGVMWRDTRLGSGSAPSILGPGAVLHHEPARAELVHPDVTTIALAPVVAAVLDGTFLRAAARWPGLMAVLYQRLAEQERDVAVRSAVGQLPRVDERILGLLWHLAERWGRVTPDGVRVPLRLTHQTLGRFVGARRPTVSLALTDLRERGLVDRAPDGAWILRGEAPQLSGPAAPLDAETLPHPLSGT